MMVEKLIHKPIAVSMSVVALTVLAIIATFLLPVSLIPPIEVPQIIVKVDAPDLSARELQQNVLDPLQRSLLHTLHLKDIEGEAKDGKASLIVSFEHGTDVSYAYIDVNERVDMAMPSLPSNIERPYVIKTSASDIPAFFLNVTLRDLNQGKDKMLELSSFVTNVISKRLEQLKSVSFVDISGRTKPQITIVADLKKLSTLGQTSPIVEDALRNQLINIGNISIKDGQYQYSVRLDGNIQNKEDVENCLLNIKGRILAIKDIANVTYEVEEEQEVILSDDRPAISMAIIKQSDARMDDLKADVKSLMVLMEKDYPNIKMEFTRDQTALLSYSIDNLISSLCFGMFLACLVIFFFMRDYKSPFLVTLSIPFSLLVSLLIFFLMGISMNIISLSGLMLGVGMMVDNSIIVIDNITEKWNKGESLQVAIVKGTEEVFSPLLSSVLTTCAIFTPLVFLNGMAGALFYDQAVAITIGLFSSLAVSMTIIPVYYWLFYKKNEKQHALAYKKESSLVIYYERGFKWVFRHQKSFFISIACLIVAAVCIFPFVKKESLPPIRRDDAIVLIYWNEPITVHENQKRTQGLNEVLKGDTEHITAMCGSHHFILSHTAESEQNQLQIYIRSENYKKCDIALKNAKKYIETHYPRAIISFLPADNIFDMVFKISPSILTAQIYSKDGLVPNPDKINLVLEKIASAHPNLEIKPIKWKESIGLFPNDKQISLYNIKYTDLYTVLKNAFGRNQIMTLSIDNQSVPVILGSDHKTLNDILSQTEVCYEQENEKHCLPVKLFLKESAVKDFSSLYTGKEGVFYPLDLDMPRRDVKSIMKSVTSLVNEDANFEVSYGGDYFSSRKMIGQLFLIFVVAFLLLFFILSAEFESLLQPLLILSEIFTGLAGVIIILFVFGQSLNLMSLIGIVMMCGIVINDSIVKIDTYNRLRKNGYSVLKAILVGGKMRVKPIVMTSLTTILAVLPLLFSDGMGADLQSPLSIVLVGGMVIGTFYSLFGLPLLYYYCYKKK